MTSLAFLRPTPTHLFGSAAVALVCVAVWPWVAPISAATPSRGENAPAKATVAPLPDAAAFAAIGERPLFSPSRRPAPTNKAPAQTGAATRYRVLGLMTVGAARRALLADGSQRIEVSEGTVLDRWTVARIEADRVVLSGPEGQAVLELHRAASEPAPTKAR